MNTKVFFLCWEGSNLILGIGKEIQIFILRTPAAIKLFHQILKNHYPPRLICMTHIWFPTVFCQGIIIFQGVLTIFNFFT